MTRRELVSSVRSELAASADSKFRKGLMWFFKEPVDPYGVRTPQVRRIAAAYREVRKARGRAHAFCRELWASGKMEKAELPFAFTSDSEAVPACEFHLFEKWIDRYVGNWAAATGCDLADCSVDRERAGLIRCYSVGCVEEPMETARGGSFVPTGGEAGTEYRGHSGVAGALLEDPDDMVQKGVAGS
jgi:hypothetical protein